MIEFVLFLAIAFVSALLITRFIYPKLKSVGMVGKDINKPERPEVAEMGGFGIIGGVTAGILAAIFFNTFLGLQFNLVFVLAALITIHCIAFIGAVDDLIDMPQAIKALLPLFAAIPLVVVKAAGSTAMAIPFIGVIDFGILYVIVLIPLGIAVASNLTNMLAGFNGMESGMGVAIFLTTSVLALLYGKTEMLVISLSMLGALLGFLAFNIYPAKAFPGDVGNLTIGAALAAAVIIGNFESAGAILLIPYVVDFFIKAQNRFPSRGWSGIYKGGKLYAPEKKVGFAQYVMKIANGISERNLALAFIGIEAVFGALVILLFAR
jgi:UDP-N-acetylglucosamine--dolichyl-phosphate N-acetylglucosaminephosphotransferase